jgi:hypothetical protein
VPQIFNVREVGELVLSKTSRLVLLILHCVYFPDLVCDFLEDLSKFSSPGFLVNILAYEKYDKVNLSWRIFDFQRVPCCGRGFSLSNTNLCIRK